MAKIEILKHGKNRFMFIDKDLWMWDTLRERKLQERLAKKARGSVLVVGYGFGIIIKFLLKNPKVKSIKIVEKHKEVINEAKKKNKIYRNIIEKDFYKLQEREKYDCIIGDIWQDIDPLFLKDYKKFKNKAEKLLNENGVVLAWGQDFFEYLLKNKNG